MFTIMFLVALINILMVKFIFGVALIINHKCKKGGKAWQGLYVASMAVLFTAFVLVSGTVAMVI